MRRLLISVLMLLCSVTFALADWFEDAIAANKQGDFAKVAEIFKGEAEQGNAKAQINLGARYNLGLGVSQDFVIAYKWANLAANRGQIHASELREKIAAKMTPEQISQAQALARDWVAKHPPQ